MFNPLNREELNSNIVGHKYQYNLKVETAAGFCAGCSMVLAFFGARCFVNIGTVFRECFLSNRQIQITKAG